MRRELGEVESALDAAHRTDQFRPPQVDHQTAEVFFRNLLRLGNILEHARFFRVVGRQIDQDPQSISPFGRDFHNVILSFRLRSCNLSKYTPDIRQIKYNFSKKATKKVDFSF